MAIDQDLTAALKHHQAGRLSEAEALYRHVLDRQPNHADALHLLGVLASQLQRYEIASDLIRRAILVKPDFPEAHVNLGVALRHQKRLDEAVASFRQAIAIRPGYAEAHHHLGCALRDKGDLAEAIACFRRAVALKPTLVQAIVDLANLLPADEAIICYQRAIALWPAHVDAHYNLANVLRDSGKPDEAVVAYRQALALKPDFVEAQNNLANVLREQGRVDEAIACCRAVLSIRPDYFEAHNTLGNALRDAGRVDEAIACYQRVVELAPDIAEGHNNLGSMLEKKDQLDAAIACYCRAISLKPQLAEAHNNLGNALRKKGELEEAMASYRRAVELRPTLAEAQLNLGNALRERMQLDEAVACFRQALMLKPQYAEAYQALGMAMKLGEQPEAAISCYELALKFKPDYPEAHANLGVVLMGLGRLYEAISEYRLVLAGNPELTAAHGNLVYALQLDPDSDAATILREQRRFGQLQVAPLRNKIQPHDNDHSPQRRLRIGYVSPDFRDHAVGWNILPLLRERDHKNFEIFCYANMPTSDAYTERFRQCADGWRDISRLGDDQAAQLVRDDRIDILVDLAQHTNRNRLMLFARKPAPVQVSFAGYPGGTGVGTIDYRLTDPYLDPPGESDEFYVEQSIRLPDSFWCYDPAAMGVAELGPVNSLPALANGKITFGCLNNFWKVNDRVLSLWAAAMSAVADSQLIMLATEGKHRQGVLDHFAGLNIDPQRIEFVGFQPRREYLRTYERIDLGLDCFPYNGHTTSLDSFWMGVPVITLVGRTVVGRAGWSQLSNLGLTELAAETPQQFVRIVTSLAGDLPRMTQLRSGLRQRMLQSPLTDAVRFARNIESVYRQMWRTWCASG